MVHLTPALFAFSLFSSIVLCSQFPIPTTWTNTTSALNREARLQVAQEGLALLLPQITGSQQIKTLQSQNNAAAASAIWVTILQDYFSNSATNEAEVKVGVESAQPAASVPSGVLSDTLLWGLVDVYAYQAYNDSTYVDLAKAIWDEASLYFVLPEQAAVGQHPRRNGTFKSTCNGETVAGAVFWLTVNVNSLAVNGETIGPFIALSSYLFEATRNTTYLSYAMLATSFVQANLLGSQVIADGIDIGSCSVAPSSSSSTVWSYDSGFVIEGWSILADVTQNETLRSILDQLVFTSALSQIWTDKASGINFEQPSMSDPVKDIAVGFKGIFMRGLHTAWTKSSPTSDIAQFIAAYITVQFNALLNQAAASSQTNIYPASWIGPPPSGLQIYPQATALQVLIPAFTLASNSSIVPDMLPSVLPSVSLSPPVPSSSSTQRPDVHIGAGAIAGAAVGGIVGVCCLTALFILILRRRSHTHLHADIIASEGAQMATIEPFTLSQASTVNAASTTDGDSRPYRHSSKSLARALQWQRRPLEAANDENQQNSSSVNLIDIEQYHNRVARVEDLLPQGTLVSTTDFRQLSQTVQDLMRVLEMQSVHPAPHVYEEEPPSYGR